MIYAVFEKVLTHCYLLVWIQNHEARKVKAAGVFSLLVTSLFGAILFGLLFSTKQHLPVPFLVLATSYIGVPIIADRLATRAFNSIAFQQECKQRVEYAKIYHLALTVVLPMLSTVFLLGGFVIGTVWAIFSSQKP